MSAAAVPHFPTVRRFFQHRVGPRCARPRSAKPTSTTARFLALLSLACLAAGGAPPASAQLIATNQGRVLSVLEENDLVVRTDRHYTQGIKLSYLESDGVVPRVVARMMDQVPTLG